ncbi:MAG TPA: cation:proton antiporter [Longimicrobiales bacterium]
MVGSAPRSTISRLATATLLVATFAGISAIGGAADIVNPQPRTAMVVGFLLLAAFTVGQGFKGARLPKITGYLVVGILVGPEVLGLLTASDLDRIRLLNVLAVGVIALIAGGELRPAMLRARGRIILLMLLAEVTVVFLLVSAALFVFRASVPFLAGWPLGAAAVLIIVFAAVATVHSPAVTIALLDEQKPGGPLTSTTLGVVVAADVLVVLMVTLALAGAKTLLAGGGVEAGFVLRLAWELIGAILLGAVAGVVIDLYLRLGGGHLVLFVVFLVFFGNAIAQAVHVEFMLFMLSAGFFIENVSPVDGEPLLDALHSITAPAYALFFALAGASMHLEELRLLWPLALLVIGVRACGLWLGCRLGARLAGAEEVVRKYTWMGLVSQAGVALGLVTVVSRVLPEAGRGMLTLFLAMIAIHELVGPILFRTALIRSGEAGRGAVGATRAARAVPVPGR